MDPHHTARLLAIARMVVGGVLMTAPGVATRAMGGTRLPATGLLLARAMGARDLALGLGAFAALSEGRDAARWVRLGALSDAVDSVAVVLAGRELGPLGSAVGATVAAGAAGLGLRTATALED